MTASKATAGCCASSDRSNLPAGRRFQGKHLHYLLVNLLACASGSFTVHAGLERDARGPMADEDAVADLHGLADLVGNEHRGLAVLPHQADEFLAQIARRH